MYKKTELLNKAHDLFSMGKYKEAIFLYSQAMEKEPLNIEYNLYILLCDIAEEDENRAHELFDYFIIHKELDYIAAITFVQNSIAAYDGNNELMLQVLNDINSHHIEKLDAIDYKDFLALVKMRSSFKEAYEDIMFSTKVAITSKDDLIDFINKLIENGLYSVAYSYLEGYGDVFTFDSEVLTLYEKLESNQFEDNK